MRHFRQALAMMREEKLFSGIYILGTALAILFTMVMAVVYYIKLAPIYPERNRARTVYFEGLRIEADNGAMAGASARLPHSGIQVYNGEEYCETFYTIDAAILPTDRAWPEHFWPHFLTVSAVVYIIILCAVLIATAISALKIIGTRITNALRDE